MNLDIKSLVGGRTKQLMLNPSYQGVDLLVASFGAFSKLVSTGVYKINQVRHVVLDEADSLLDDSFIEKVSHLMSKVKVCTVLFPYYTQTYQIVIAYVVLLLRPPL